MQKAVPYITAGKADRPQKGGCVMQLIDWLERNNVGEYTELDDHPACVLPVFQSFAIQANDDSQDEERQKLLDLVPRLRGTAYTEERWLKLNPSAGQWEEKVWRKMLPEEIEYNREANQFLDEWVSNNPREETCNCTENCCDGVGETQVAYLTRMLDAFEEKYGERKPTFWETIDWTPITNWLQEADDRGLVDQPRIRECVGC